jgi:membrane-associated phospholipid phosphatase
MTTILSALASFDRSVLYAVQSLGPKWQGAAYFISHGVGSYPIMLGVFAVALLMIEKRRVAFEVIIVALFSFGVLSVLKHLFHIDRPYIVDPRVIAYDHDASFALPSGHALMSTVILGWIALRHPKSRVLWWGAGFLVFMIGLSRVYLGVHYPSQVLAGWILGVLILYVAHALSKRLWSPFEKKLDKR